MRSLFASFCLTAGVIALLAAASMSARDLATATTETPRASRHLALCEMCRATPRATSDPSRGLPCLRGNRND
jgi:hypothetical protein